MRITVAFAALLAAACTAPQPQAETELQDAAIAATPADVQAVAQGNADFGIALYHALATEPGNLFISPVSIAGAFGPVIAGARTDTRTAIAGALHLPHGGPGLHPALGTLLRDLTRSKEGATLSIANAMWVQQGFSLKPEFAGIARTHYGATFDVLDFNQRQAAADRINRWVSDETRGRIPKLMTPAMFNERTRLAVTNAVYFLGDWATPFNASYTSQQPFYLADGTSKPAPLMRRRDALRYFETESFQAVDLPYKDDNLSMSVFLPKARQGLAAFEAGLSPALLRQWLAKLDSAQPGDLLLYLPKLSLAEDYELKPALAALGMGIAFSESADFTGIADADLFISDVVHKSFLRIDEKGTEAAAATGVVIEQESAPPTLRADHPFFLVIREKQGGAILFMGRVASPEPA